MLNYISTFDEFAIIQHSESRTIKQSHNIARPNPKFCWVIPCFILYVLELFIHNAPNFTLSFVTTKFSGLRLVMHSESPAIVIYPHLLKASHGQPCPIINIHGIMERFVNWPDFIIDALAPECGWSINGVEPAFSLHPTGKIGRSPLGFYYFFCGTEKSHEISGCIDYFRMLRQGFFYS